MHPTMMDPSKHISEKSKKRDPSAIRAIMPYTHDKEILSLGAGQPNPATFPFASMSVTLKSGETIEMDDELFRQSLSYDLSGGERQLSEWLRVLQIVEHNPPGDFSVAVGCGSQDLLTKALEMAISDGDTVLVEDPTYTGILSFLESQDCHLAAVKTDAHGAIPETLESILANWPENSGKRRPHCFYTVPSGGNPTGVSCSLERKKAIYQICSKYDILIIEDDPYYYLQFGKTRIPSYLSMDTESRVLRCDSMSKILSSGIRIGWATGHATLIDRMNMHTMVTNLQPSGMPQLVTYSLLKKWGYKGFLEHTDRVSDFYREKRDEFIECLDRRMKGRAEWSVPDAGMFVWLRLLGGINDSYDLVMTKAIKKKVLAIPGVAFMPHRDTNPYIRVSFSNISKQNMDEALRRLAAVVDEEAAKNNVSV